MSGDHRPSSPSRAAAAPPQAGAAPSGPEAAVTPAQAAPASTGTGPVPAEAAPDSTEAASADAEDGTRPTFRKLVQSAFAPFAVAGFLATAAQLLDVSGWAIFALVVVGGAGVIVAHWRWRSSRWQSFTAGGVFAACAVGILALALLQPPEVPRAAGQAPLPAGPSVYPVGPPD